MPGGLKEGNVSCMLLTTWPGSVSTTYSKKGWRAANEEGLPPLAAADSPNVCSSRPAAVELAAAAARFLDAVGVGRLSTAQGTVDNVRAPLEAFTAADTILFRESAFVTCSRVSLSAAVPLNVASSSSVSGWAAGVVLLVLALLGGSCCLLRWMQVNRSTQGTRNLVMKPDIRCMREQRSQRRPV